MPIRPPAPICIFCGERRKMSKEHVIPQWVSKELAKDPRELQSPITVCVDGKPTRQMPSSRVINIVTKRVCKVCNEGWMETWLERPVQPTLTSMLHGERTVLDVEARVHLAGWAAKVAMVAGYAQRPPEPVRQDWLPFMYDQHIPPPDWHVWTTGYEGATPALYERGTFTRLLPDGRPSGDHGITMTLVVGYVAFKIVGIAGAAPDFLSRDHVSRLWPPFTFDALVWPPRHHLDDSTLQSFAKAFEHPRPVG